MVLSSCRNPGGFPTLCSGTNRLGKVDRVDLALCTMVNDDAPGSWSTEFGIVVARPPYVILLRMDCADVRRPGLGVSENDLGGMGWDGE